MSDDALNLNKKLRLGIEAARTGQKNVAQVHLNAVLKEQPDNIPAMLWLAFVLSSPQESLRLLERVLELDPANERAISGVRWAKQRLGQSLATPVVVETKPAPMATTPLVETQPQPATAPPEKPPTIPSAGIEALRKKLLSKEESQESAKKGVLAHRARRTIDPLTMLLIIAGALTLMALGLGALAFAPSDTIAAWLPLPTPTVQVMFKPVVASSPATVVHNLVSARDSLPATPTVAPTLLTEIQEQATATTATPVTVIPARPSVLVGPTQPPTLTPPTPTLTPTAVPAPVPSPTPAPSPASLQQPAYGGEKWIEVNVTTQQLTAWEGNQPVYSFAVSTGLPGTPTVLGEYHIYWKLTSTLMVGPNYYLPEVPYTMYFYRGYALHGTYWHNNFGQPMSHGCVNLATPDAKTLFEWAGPIISPGLTEAEASAQNPGTRVVVHE